MKNPDSLAARLRWWLAKKIEPKPDPGETWCLQCTLHGGRTQVLPADGAANHARSHLPGDRIVLTSMWPGRQP